jgi:hypothetical protein
MATFSQKYNWSGTSPQLVKGCQMEKCRREVMRQFQPPGRAARGAKPPPRQLLTGCCQRGVVLVCVSTAGVAGGVLSMLQPPQQRRSFWRGVVLIRAAGVAGGVFLSCFRSVCCSAGAGVAAFCTFCTAFPVSTNFNMVAVTALCSSEEILAGYVSTPDVIYHLLTTNLT